MGKIKYIVEMNFTCFLPFYKMATRKSKITFLAYIDGLR